MAKQAEPEIHKYIDELCERGFYGAVTLFVQNGNIESIRPSETLNKKDIIGMYGGAEPGVPRKTGRVHVVAGPKAAIA